MAFWEEEVQRKCFAFVFVFLFLFFIYAIHFEFGGVGKKWKA